MNTNKLLKVFIAIVLGFSTLSLNAQTTPPEPVSGKSLVKDYITQNLVYPENDLKAGKSGTVVVGLHVDKDGNSSHYTVKQSFSEEASPIAIAMVKTILWKPALISGIPADYDTEYEVEFNVKRYNRYWKRNERIVPPLTLEADTSNRIFEYKTLEEVAKPYFADGKSIAQYIYTNLKFPAEAKEREIQGTVRLSFVVEKDGSISNIIVVNSVGGGCDNEAIRLMQGTVWIPAERHGKYVRSTNMQDITFSIGSHNFQDGNNY